eukprot:2758603-Lingulodinium_polyedra.AAC.1
MVTKAMVAVKRNRPDRQPFVSFFRRDTEPPNMAECCGIFRFLSTLGTKCFTKQLPVAMEGLRYISRLKLHRSFKEQFKVLSPWADQALINHYMATKSRTDPEKKFVELNKQVLTMFIDEVAVEKVIEARQQNKLTTVAKELYSLVDA